MGSLADNLKENAEVFERTPALILHGSGDKLFDVKGSHGLHSLWCDVAQKSGVYPRLKIYDGAYHQLLNEPNKDEVLNEIVLFVASKSSARIEPLEEMVVKFVCSWLLELSS